LSVKVEHVEKNMVCLQVEVDKDKVNAAITTAVRSLAHRVKVPGFRRGRVPKNILELTVGKDAILSEALESLVPEAYSRAVEEEDLEPIDSPEVEVVTIEEGTPLVFKATVPVKPEVTLGDYKGLAIDKEKFSVEAEEVEQVLHNLRERQATYEVSNEEPIATGDLVMVDFSGTVDGKPFEGSKADNMPLVIGAPGFFPGLSERLVGAKHGDTLEVEIPLPEDFHVSAVAGRKAKFDLTVKDVRKKRLAKLDDEFARDISDFDTLAELKANCEQQLYETKKQRIQEKMEAQAIKQVVERSEVDVPDIMTKRRARSMLNSFARELEYRGTSLEKYCELREKTEEEVKQELFPTARDLVKQELVLDAIAKKENITVNPDKLEQALEGLAAAEQDSEQAKERWRHDGTRDALAVNLLRRETINWLLQQAEITEVDPKLDDDADADNNKDKTDSEQEENQ